METLQELQEFFSTGHLNYRPNLTIDSAIFGYHDGELQLLLVKNKIITKWCLPGGFVRKNESLDQAATRITAERTGIDNLFLKQFKAFGDPGRNDPSGAFDPEKLFELVGVRLADDTWLTGETVSVGFYAITDIVNAKPNADFMSSECAWFSVDKLPPLAFDHDKIVREALFTMRVHLYHFPIGQNFLQQKNHPPPSRKTTASWRGFWRSWKEIISLTKVLPASVLSAAVSRPSRCFHRATAG